MTHAPSPPRHPGLLLLVSCLLLAAACATEASEVESSSLLVFAAASLTDAFSALEEGFETDRPDVDVRISFAASSALREQILEGAPADVFASANPQNMDAVVAAGAAAAEPVLFARNRMEIAVPAGNPAGVTGLADFARSDLLIGLCAAGVPCGDFGRIVLARAAVVASLDTAEPTVRSLLTKLEAGELDAGLVYRSDVATSDRVEGIAVPPAWNVDARYPIVVLTGGDDRSAAEAFVRYVLSAQGAAILAAHGFDLP